MILIRCIICVTFSAITRPVITVDSSMRSSNSLLPLHKQPSTLYPAINKQQASFSARKPNHIRCIYWLLETTIMTCFCLHRCRMFWCNKCFHLFTHSFRQQDTILAHSGMCKGARVLKIIINRTPILKWPCSDCCSSCGCCAHVA